MSTYDVRTDDADLLRELVTELLARVYCLEVGLGLRQHGDLGADGLRFMGGASRAALNRVQDRARARFGDVGPA